MKRLILSLALLLLIPTDLSSQENTCLRRVLPVSVVGRDEVPVAGVTAENFRGSFQGTPVRILSTAWHTGSRRVVILLDLSERMGGQRQWGPSNKNEVIEFLARDAVQFTRSSDKVSLVTFANSVTQRTSLTVERTQANAWIDQMARKDLKMFKGRSNLFAALGTAVDILSPYQLGDAIYLITDSFNAVRQEQIGEIESRFLSTGVRLFAVLLQDRNTFGVSRDFRYIPLVDELLELTGGASWVMTSTNVAPRGSVYDLSEAGHKDISAAVNTLYKQIERFYLMEIELPREVDKPRPWKLELIPIGGQQIKSLSLYYPKKLLPCSTAKATQQPTPK